MIVQDYFRYTLFHAPENVSYHVASVEHDPAGDIIHTSQITQIRKSTVMKNYGGSELVHCSHMEHTAITG